MSHTVAIEFYVKINIAVSQQKILSLMIESALEDDNLSMYQMETLKLDTR